MRTRISILAVAAALLGVTACGDSKPSAPSAPVPAETSLSQAQTPPAPAVPFDAKTMLEKLTDADVGLAKGTVQDEDTDPNNLLGRPNGYTSRASADLPGGAKDGDKYSIERGLVIEVFATKDDADRRSTFIQDSLRSMPILGTEYHYRADGGRVLVRVTGKVKPSASKKIEQVVASL
ncbi:hypothetical protein ABZ570_31565 [Micromonospora sp. NPDC007271]|uniref:hypothetical protein n=1 Tax=Micromonospora sp. NPDC007271 TaxID=3154587 RepID=UPI0033C0BC93